MAAVIVQDASLLVVSKQAAPDVFYLPGGKPDPGQQMQTLSRELGEELGVRPEDPRFFADVAARAVVEGVAMAMTVFEVDISQAPQPAAELADMRWVSGAESDV